MNTDNQRPLDDLSDLESPKPKTPKEKSNGLWQVLLFFGVIALLVFIRPDPSPKIDWREMQEMVNQQNVELRENTLKNIQLEVPELSLTDSIVQKILDDSSLHQRAIKTDSLVRLIDALKN